MSATVRCYWSNGVRPDGTKIDARHTPEDIIEMQKIDADCNDCAHFRRGKLAKWPGITMFEGRCAKFDKPAKAFPVQYSGHKCFEHRREVSKAL